MIRLRYNKNDLGKSLALTVFVALVASLLLSAIFGAETSGWKFWLMQALYTLAIGSSALIYAAASKTNVVTATKMNVAPKWAHLLWGFGAVLCLIAAMIPLNDWILDGIERLGFNRPSVDFDDSLAGLLIVACLLPCVTEEIVFRGTVAQSLYGIKNKLGAIAISGALFSLFHANPAQTVHQFVLGCFLTLLVFRSGSLWTSVIVHFFNNALVVALSYTPFGSDEFLDWQTNKVAILITFFAGLVGFCLCVFGYLKTTKSSWQQDDDGAQSIKTDVTSTIMLTVAVIACLALWVTSLFS